MRYLESIVMGHTTHEDLMKHFSAVLEPLDMKDMYHISIDDPQVSI